jgi:hypothetical protein
MGAEAPVGTIHPTPLGVAIGAAAGAGTPRSKGLPRAEAPAAERVPVIRSGGENALSRAGTACGNLSGSGGLETDWGSASGAAGTKACDTSGLTYGARPPGVGLHSAVFSNASETPARSEPARCFGGPRMRGVASDFVGSSSSATSRALRAEARLSESSKPLRLDFLAGGGRAPCNGNAYAQGCGAVARYRAPRVDVMESWRTSYCHWLARDPANDDASPSEHRAAARRTHLHVRARYDDHGTLQL